MLQNVRSWLNSPRNYSAGIKLYAANNPVPAILKNFQLGENEFRKKRLLTEILAIYEKLNPSGVSTEAAPVIHPKRNPDPVKSAKATDTPPVNEALFLACKLAADTAYKMVMNKRAVLAKLASIDTFDINREELVSARSKMAVEIVVEWQQMSNLYDQAMYAKLHGRLPNEKEEGNPETEYDHLPDNLVKQTLDNLRKAHNKLKKKESTPWRVAHLQQQELNIKKLIARWHSLQPAK